MLEVSYKGGNAVIISTKNGSVVINPKASVYGLKDVPVKDAVQLATEDRLKVDVAETRVTIDGPGEYEVGEFSINGAPAKSQLFSDGMQDTIYRVVVSGIAFGVVGNIQAPLSEEQQEVIGIIDVLIIPVGGGDTLDSMDAVKIVRQLEPRAVIPVHYQDADATYEVPQEPVGKFTTDLSAPVQEFEKYKLKNLTALPEVLTSIVLKRQ